MRLFLKQFTMSLNVSISANEASLLQKDNAMKTIFNVNSRGRTILYILFAVAVLSFAAFLLVPLLFSMTIPSFVGIAALIGIVLFGGIIIQMRSGPPW
jgi:hypothetical protein